MDSLNKAKKKRERENDCTVDMTSILIGDVVAIEWLDAHEFERIRVDEIDHLDDPGLTRCWGAVVRKSERYLFIASEIGDRESDGVWIEALPYGMVRSCKVIDHIDLTL